MKLPTTFRDINIGRKITIRSFGFEIILLTLESWMTFTLPGLKVIKLEYILRLKIKRNDWLIVDTCPQAANHYALFLSLRMNSSFINLRPGGWLSQLVILKLRFCCC